MRRPALAAVLLLALVSCREDFFDPTPGQTAADDHVELIARNVEMLTGADNAVRIAFSPKEPAVRIRIERSTPAGRVVACPLSSIADPIPPPAACLPDLPDGVRESLTLSGLGAIALVREGSPMKIDLRMEFEDAGRDLTLRLPLIPRPGAASVCRDYACNPIFEVEPVRAGAFRAAATWDGGPARLEMVEGRVLARAFSSTGIPYGVADEATGSPPLQITARLQAPSEYALALVNTSAAPLTGIEITATWP